MREIRFYEVLSRAGFLNYRAKIMVMAFLGTHIPLIALISFFALKTETSWQASFATIAVALGATLVGTALTLLVLDQLLRPILLTSRSLRTYKTSRTLLPLPVHFTDEAGTLMADAATTLGYLDGVRDRLEHLDPESGLPNRRKFALDVAARRSGGPFMVCVVSFGGYGKVGAAFDHRAAETAFRDIAAELGSALPRAAGLARIDPDKLAWIAACAEDGAMGWAETTSAVRRVIAGCGSGFGAADGRVLPSLRAGLASYPEDAGEPDALIDFAVTASSLASDADPVAVHSPEARKAALERFSLEQELTRALSGNQFTLHFQPVIDLSLGQAVGAEALIRWQHPERGLVPPGAFIPVAEASGLIDPIGLWVMRRACQQLHAWGAAGMGNLTLAINLSARQFLDASLVGQIKEALAESRVSPDRLEIELTETAAMVDHGYTRAVFGKLRDLGVRIAIDDFGTGYASMSYLRKLPFDKLKIDREFVSDVHRTRDAQAICGAVVELAKGLGLEVLAEGTETEQEVLYLHGQGCRLFQGYFFSKPVPASALPAAIADLGAARLALRAASAPPRAA